MTEAGDYGDISISEHTASGTPDVAVKEVVDVAAKSSPGWPSPSALRASLHKDGFVVIPALVPADELQKLRDASSHLTSLARAGQWPHIRTLPKQFPPWSNDPSNGIWGVQHLMHPEIPRKWSDVFTQSYFNHNMIKMMKILLGCDEDSEPVRDEDLIMELYNLLVRPDRDFELRWHRDDIRPEATDEEELEVLGKRQWHAQWNTALYHDSSLIVVPGSHRRARTMQEKAADLFTKEIEGMMTVELMPGDAVFYNNNILHRGVYKADNERMTLHGSVGHRKGGNGRARNVLQHGVGDWVRDIKEFDGLDVEERRQAELMKENLIALGSQNGDVGFSQDG